MFSNYYCGLLEVGLRFDIRSFSPFYDTHNKRYVRPILEPNTVRTAICIIIYNRFRETITMNQKVLKSPPQFPVKCTAKYSPAQGNVVRGQDSLPPADGGCQGT